MRRDGTHIATPDRAGRELPRREEVTAMARKQGQKQNRRDQQRQTKNQNN
jgi:hypothetical protein